MFTKEISNKIYQQFQQAQNILFLTHNRPDGDGLSSVCIMIELAQSLGKTYTAYCLDAPSPIFDFLPNIEKFKSEADELDFSQFDLIIPLDCGSLKRTGFETQISARAKHQIVAEIDHHPKVDDYADLELRQHTAASTTEILFDFLKDNRITINKNMATCILTGIITDTGNFLYPSTSEKTVEISSEMMSLGARLPKLIENTWRNKSLAAMKIWGKAMSHLEINEKYNIAFTVLPQKDLTDSNLTADEIDGISNFIGNMHDVKAVMLLTELEEGFIKGSLRSSDPDMDISILAKHLGGGGHAKASGFVVKGKLERIEGRWKIT